MQNVALPGSDYYLRFKYSGNKTKSRSSNPSGVLSRKLDRPDMLLVSSGATVLVGEDKVSMNVWQLCSISALLTVLTDAKFRPFLMLIWNCMSAGRGPLARSCPRY